jgi:transposase InsO family protein
VRQLKREMERVKQERDILKKQLPSFRASSLEISIHRRSSAAVSCEPALRDAERVDEWVLCIAETPDESAKAEKMASLPRIQGAYHTNRGVYGSPRIHAELQAQVIRCARKRVARLMKEWELVVLRPHHRSITTRSDPSARFAPNGLDRNLAAVLDHFSRRVGGWAMAASADDPLVEKALRMALQKRHPQAGLLHHTDYTSTAYQALLADRGITVSMSRKGNY